MEELSYAPVNISYSPSKDYYYTYACIMCIKMCIILNCYKTLSLIQNGSIWDGLISWKKNLDKKFAGVEECYICFSIFHISTYQIPKLSCHTCRKKFHTPCLVRILHIIYCCNVIVSRIILCCSFFLL